MAWEIAKIQTMLNSKALCTVSFSFCWLYFWAASRTKCCMIGLLRPCLPTLIARLLVTSWQKTALSCRCQSMLYATLRTAAFPPVLSVAWLCLTLGLLKPDTAKIYLYSVWVIALLNSCFEIKHVNLKDQAFYSWFPLIARHDFAVVYLFRIICAERQIKTYPRDVILLSSLC